MSKAEDKIAALLNKSNIKFIREKTYSDLKHGYLRYDFYLPIQNVLLEYDSEIHFYQVSKFHKTKQDFQHAQENDRIKNSYALSHSIPLYRISFWELNSIKEPKDLFQTKFLVKNRFHNDIVYREYKWRQQSGKF